MPGITIEIRSNEDIRYVPDPFVKHGDTVTFQVVDIPGEVDVSFDDGNSCLTPPGPYQLNGNTLATSSTQNSVSFTAHRGLYPFTVTIPGSLRKGGELETKKGGIDVTTDPPTETEEKKRK